LHHQSQNNDQASTTHLIDLLSLSLSLTKMIFSSPRKVPCNYRDAFL
jgi:hypothetical protein